VGPTVCYGFHEQTGLDRYVCPQLYYLVVCVYNQSDLLVLLLTIVTRCCYSDATAWVKKYSEIEYAKQGGGGGTKSVPAKKHHWWNRSKRAADDPSTTSELWNDEPNTPVRITRVALVSTVLALLFYNLHLYFSQ
jgi:hypothetical protein